jgi:hypothetical protein
MTQLDIAFIEKNVETIIPKITQESVDVYRFLSSEFKKSKVDCNYLFQFVFRSFYRIDNAGLTSDFKKRYFELLEAARDAESIDIAGIVTELQEFPNLKGQASVQFSFATKLASTANNRYPIYDKEVGRMFDFEAPYSIKDTTKRLAKYSDFYQGLTSSYEKIIVDGQLKSARNLFRTFYSAYEVDFPEMKVIDFIVWQAGKLKNMIKKN